MLCVTTLDKSDDNRHYSASESYILYSQGGRVILVAELDEGGVATRSHKHGFKWLREEQIAFKTLHC